MIIAAKVTAPWSSRSKRAALAISKPSSSAWIAIQCSNPASAMRARFQEILTDFFPRYVAVLSEFQPAIDEIRIEGHTSSEWNGASPQQAYYNNMALSQARTREVLSFVLSLPVIAPDRAWMQSLLTANGLSSSRLIRDSSGVEDPNLSRRVEFRVRTKARSEIVRILEEVQ